MKGTKQGGKPLRGTEHSPLALLRRSCPDFLSAIASVKEPSAKKSSTGTRGGAPKFAQDVDATMPLHCLRTGASGAAWANVDGLFNLQADSADASPTALDGLTEGVQDKNPSTRPTKKRRRDGVTPLTAIVAPAPPSSAASASNWTEDSSINAPTSAGSSSRGRRALSESSRRFLREALVSYSRRDDDAIPDELVANLDGMTFFQLLQQCSGDVCVSLERTEEGSDEKDGLNYSTPPLSTTTNSSSSLNGGGNVPIGRLSKRDLQAQLSAALAWASYAVHSVDGDEDEDDDDDEDEDDDDDGGVTVRLPRAILETASQIDHPSVVFELLQCKDAKERGSDAAGRGGKTGNADASDDNDDNDDSEDEDEEEYEEGRSFHDEDLDDLKETTEKVSRLSLNTMKKLATWWSIHLEDEKEELCRMTITEHLRLLAFTICAIVSNKLEPQAPMPFAFGANRRQDGNNANNPSLDNAKALAEAADSALGAGVGGVMLQRGDDQDGRVRGLLSLRHDICTLSAEHLRYFANAFGFLDRCWSPEDIFMAISAASVMTFFSPLPTPLLEKVCHELSISTVHEDTDLADIHQLPELLAEKISHYFYPPRHAVPSISKLSFMPQMQIHEHAPGRYTCTVDSAKIMKVMVLQRLVSNRFSCNKIRWHALLTVVDDKLSFYVWHRHTDSLTAHMIVRTQDPKKKRKNNVTNGGDNNNKNRSNAVSPSPEVTLKESSALFLEQEVEAAPGELIGFESFVSLTVALQSSTMSQSGYRLYNRAEDRLVFQYAMDLTTSKGPPLAEDGGKKLNTNHQNGKGSLAKRGFDNNVDQSTGGQQTTADSVAAAMTEENERRRKELEKLVVKLEKHESQQRDTIELTWNSGYRQLLNEHGKSYQKALQKKKDRERKMLLAKAGPSPELLRELDTLTQTVTTNRAQVAKLATEKSKEEASIKKFQEQIEDGNREMEQLHQQLKSGNELLSTLEAEAAACAAQRKERQELKRRKQRDLAAALRIPELSSTRHETLAINDLQSFWAPSSTSGGTPQLFPTFMTPTRPSPQCSPPLLAAAAHGVSPDANSILGGGAAAASGNGSSIPLPRSAVGSCGGAFSPALQPSAAGVMGVGLSTWGSLTDPLSFSAGVQCGDTLNAFDSSSTTALFSAQPPPLQLTDTSAHLAGADVAVGVGTGVGSGLSGGFTVTAPFTTGGAVARFTLDANACPFTPTSLVPGQTSGNTVTHPSFAVKAGPGHVSGKSPLSTSPMTGISGSSPVISGGAFPERPRYTSVSRPMSGGMANAGAFPNDAPQSTASLFALPGLASGSGTQPQPNTKGLSLNFTTAPWN
ncbi:hypothetical protein TraAM80_03205 [Trypanosoma rangeli]|uniref:Uncharacterized protein n=1 Tax=Trypanosoma rangeli TaxID=5698 RepID=A0A3R7KHC3_TRYRA|nr:uncharacterized protein TraAM80_03205 [Trypanosoma rangeli]RNF07683.1 hypothetical protein TraAM80_03205 [Trypanosoma rangeli]|eukprot:RNF07683.1 hypothetical protein TraAM80_03205 [Trypanosoma rangeli]